MYVGTIALKGKRVLLLDSACCGRKGDQNITTSHFVVRIRCPLESQTALRVVREEGWVMTGTARSSRTD